VPSACADRSQDRRPVAIDFYNNYITNSHDNPIEADGSMHNIRVMRNMLINHASHALCNQPALGGPVYWIRNIAYHLPGGSTRLTNGSAGVIFYNNTILSETAGSGSSNTHWRNNLMLGENAAPAILSVTTFTVTRRPITTASGPNPGVESSFQWVAPPRGVVSDYPAPGHPPTLETRRFATLAEYSQATGPGPEQHPRGLRHLRERAAARRPGNRECAEALSGGGFRFQAQTCRGSRGSRRCAAECQRRLRRGRRRTWVRWKWNTRSRITARAPVSVPGTAR
jgi:hypothetical protein